MIKMSPAVQKDINLLHASVLSMVEFDEDIFAGGHCFDENQNPLKKGLFCPFAHRLPAPEVDSLILVQHTGIFQSFFFYILIGGNSGKRFGQ